MKKRIFTGSGVAIVTPFTEDGINFKALGDLIDFNINNGTDAIVICGTTGESATMTDQEHEDAIHFAVKHTDKRVPVVAGAGSNDTKYSANLAIHAQNVGADGLLLVTPYYNKTSQAGLVKHFTYVADRVDIPVIVYNVPSRTGMSISVDSYVELAKHPNIIATKEASGNISEIAKVKALCGDDMDIYSGNDDQIVPLLSLGGIGVISVVANILPKETHDICQLFFDGKIKESCALQLKLLHIINALFCEVNPIPVKTALRLMGYQVGPLRMPLVDMAPQNLELLKTHMKENGLI